MKKNPMIHGMTSACRRLAALGLALAALAAQADPQAIERARGLLGAGNAKQAYAELSPLQEKLAGDPEYDYLLGVAALDSGRIAESIVAFERVLAVLPNHAGAQMDLARAYYASGSFDLAEAGFLKLRAANPPPAARQAIGRYLDAIQARKRRTQPGWASFGELGLGYDSNITGVPVDFGAAALQSFNLIGIEATGNSIKRSAAFAQGTLGTEYHRPLAAGWTAFAGGEARVRHYHDEPRFRSWSAEAHAGASLTAGPNQWRATGSFLEFDQRGDAPGDPQPTNDRRMGGVGLDWRHALDTKTQLGAALQWSRVRFPRNEIEDFDQVFAALSWLRSFERPGVPLLYLSAFASDDRAKNEFADGTTTKGKRLAGARGYLQYSLDPRLQLFGTLSLIHRRDRDAFARSTQVEKGRDSYSEAAIGAQWQFQERCALRVQWAYSRNRSNIDLYDFDRHEALSAIRCDL